MMGQSAVAGRGEEWMRINGVFEGGGVKGIALAGAILAAEQLGFTFHQVAGTSSGAIIASLLAAGYTAEEIKQEIIKSPLGKLVRPSDWMKIKWVGPPIRLLLYKGLYSGNPLECWVRDLLDAKGIRTFKDLPKNKLRIVASDISDGRLVVLPDDSPRYDIDPESFEIARAIRMSASIPYFFEPVIIRKAAKVPIYVVDGAVLSNFPLWLFDGLGKSAKKDTPSNMIPTVGFQLVGRNEQVPRRVNGPFSMLYALFATMMEAHDERYIEDENRFRTIKIPTLGIRTTQFELTNEESMGLFDSGYKAGMKYFDKWSLSTYMKLHDQHVASLKV
jgi:NTE family protein